MPKIIPSSVFALASFGLVALSLATIACANEIVPAADRPLPKSPLESARCARLMSGFRLDLVAAEPLVRDPTAMAFDEQGRLFVCEIHGYNLDGYLDAVELNKTGKLDREVRRVRFATPESQEAANKETYGTVKLLSDTDGDGLMDAADIWADRLPPCYGVIAARGGVIAVCAPDIVFLADRDGDGKAEIRETLFSGFQRTLLERGISNPRWGPDNWIYVASGGLSGKITGPKITEPVALHQSDFRLRADGSAIEPVTGRESMFGLALNDRGDRFHTILSYSIPLPYRYLARNPFLESPPGDVSIAASRELFPISEPDPWRKARGEDPAWVKFYGAAETQPNGNFTAPCGQVIYRADAFPEAYRGNYFVCDPANNLIHRSLLESQGSEYLAQRAAENASSEFLASSDQWFRPINLTVAPDGSLYIVDMYREIIEDFSAIPRYLQQQYAESLVAGSDHGRLWHLSWQGDGRPTRPSSGQRLDQFSAPQLVAHLDHANHWQRETAQRLLVERSDPTAYHALRRQLREGSTPPGRLLALYALAGLSRLEPDDVAQALADPSDMVRVHALQLGDRWLDQHPTLLKRAASMTSDSDARVRLQVALSLGESKDEQAIDALVRLAADHGHELWMSAGIASSLGASADVALSRLLSIQPPTDGVLAVLAPAAETIGAQRNATVIGRLLEQTAGLAGRDGEAVQHVVLKGLVKGLERGASHELPNDAMVRGLEQLLSNPSPRVTQQAMRLAGLLQLANSSAMNVAWETSLHTALDEQQTPDSRRDAVLSLTSAPWERLHALGALLDARQPTELQVAVVKTLGAADRAEVADTLLANWNGLIPQVQESIVDALFARSDRVERLLDAIERGVVPKAGLGGLRREQLLEHRNPTIRARATQLLLQAGMEDDRAQVLERYESALKLARDPQRGAAIYEKICSKCHRLGSKGHEVGPDLLAARTRPDETLLVDILAPSRNLAHGYTVYAVTTTEGRVQTGLLAGDSATSVTLRTAAEQQAGAQLASVVETTVLRKDIDEMRALSTSLMPDGLEKELTPQDLANLIGFLRQSLGPVIAPSVVLFDDEPDFLAKLTDGDAVASLALQGQFSGQAALHLTAGQRYSPNIDGWGFSIVEHPLAEKNLLLEGPASDGRQASIVPRSYRYLRFSWKSAGATGVMIELASKGKWPPPDQPQRRYVSGHNSSGWAATEISRDLPTEWTTVTVDLWKDFGEFTLSGIAPTALGGPALFDRIELYSTLDDRP